MPEEVGAFRSHLSDPGEQQHGDLTLHRGRVGPHRVSLAWSGWGKVAAARAATRLLAAAEASDPVDLLLFTGVAGGAAPQLRQWDVLLADPAIQHDMDASPLVPRFTLPPLNIDRLHPTGPLRDWALRSLQQAAAAGALDGFGTIRSGLVGTGDRFIAARSSLDRLREDLPDLQAVEMEGAAVAQVAVQEGVPWLVVRVISDGADDGAAASFSDFVAAYDARAWRIIEALLQRLDAAPLRQESADGTGRGA
ncbi:5'-methylthioadenosine/adenosylhomocysteine nucleosidase [Synechococcus sp. RSCCF101]|nr:5'-methylthioadenosine/adenosylhomocysteine nucleosidase [Synechococcus sp. RSCCF101]